MVLSRDQNEEQNYNLKTGNKHFQSVEQPKYLDIGLTIETASTK
jgi:hypothetical protein